MYVLLKCWYEGDSNLVDDSFITMSEDKHMLLCHALDLHPNEKVCIYNENEVPDDGMYEDHRNRYRIIEFTPI